MVAVRMDVLENADSAGGLVTGIPRLDGASATSRWAQGVDGEQVLGQ